MPIVLFDPELVQTRIATAVTSLKKVGGSIDLASAQGDLKALVPAAFVFPLRETPRPNNVETIVSQQDIVRFAVLLCVRNVADATGEAGRNVLRALRTDLITSLLGWTPDGAIYDPFQYGGGRLITFDSPNLWWQDEFITAVYLRSA